MSNISLPDPNFVYVDNYFYTINNSLQLLIKTTFDGEIAFCYALDIPVEYQVVSLDYDGVYFWSLEKGSSNVIIRKWKIVDLMCVQRSKFTLSSIPGTETINGYAFAVEHYTIKLTGSVGENMTILPIDDSSRLRKDLHLVIGPNSSGQSEEKVVDSFTETTVTIKTLLDYQYSSGVTIKFYKDGYYFNDFDGTDSSKGSLYEIDLESGSVHSRNPGTQFKDVKSAVFGQVKDKNGDAVYDFNDDGIVEDSDVVNCIIFIKGTLMFFSNIDSLAHTVYGSMVMDLMSGGLPQTVYDLTLGRDTSTVPDPNSNGSTIYMLKNGSTYNYQVAQFDKMVNSITVTSAPAILPADTVSTSLIEAVVLDQYNRPFMGKTVYFELSGTGSLSATNADTNSNGVASIHYIAGDTVATATITATVHQS